MYAYIHTHLHTPLSHTCIYMYTYVRTYIHIQTYTCIHTLMHTYMHACMHAYIYIHTHTHIHTHTLVILHSSISLSSTTYRNRTVFSDTILQILYTALSIIDQRCYYPIYIHTYIHTCICIHIPMAGAVFFISLMQLTHHYVIKNSVCKILTYTYHFFFVVSLERLQT